MAKIIAKKKPFLKDLLKNKNLRLLLASQFCSNITATTLLFTLMNFIFEKSQSTITVGILLFFYYLPTGVLGIFSGAIIDKSNKKKILIFSNLTQAFVALLFLFISYRPFLAYLIIFLYSSLDEFFNPTVGTVIPNVVKKEDLGSTNAIWLFASHGSLIFGSLTAGLLLKVFGHINFIFPTASILLLSAALFSALIPEKVINQNKKYPNISLHFNFLDFWEDVKQGYNFVCQKKIIFFPILLLAGAEVIISIIVAIIPAFSQIIHIAFADASFFIITPIILGTLSGAWVVSQKIKTKKIRKKKLIFGGVTACGTLFILITAATFISRPVPLIAPLLFLAGFSFIFFIVPIQTLIQENTPSDIRGRVYGILGTLIALAAFIPSLIIISLVDLLGIRLILLSLGISLFSLSYFVQKNQQKLFAQLNHI